MKIENKEDHTVMLCDIKRGSVFLNECGYYFIKTDMHKDGECTCVNLDSGILVKFDECIFMTPVNAKVVIE